MKEKNPCAEIDIGTIETIDKAEIEQLRKVKSEAAYLVEWCDEVIDDPPMVAHEDFRAIVDRVRALSGAVVNYAATVR